MALIGVGALMVLITEVVYGVRYFENNKVIVMPDKVTAHGLVKRLRKYNIPCEVVHCRMTRGSWETVKDTLLNC